MNPAPHVMIMASAGSGKTYALTNRYVALLASGASPDRIVALTFTRKAAGEFFDEILHKLAEGARDDAGARRVARAVKLPQLARTDFVRLLRGMVDAMPRLKLGTLDSFFSRVARAFPLELGLAGDFEILQEHAQRLERRRVLLKMFMRDGAALSDAQSEFIEAFKRATFGAEEKQLGARLDAFLDKHQERYLAAPDAACWGNPAAVWPGGCRWLDDGIDVAAAARDLRASLGPLTDGQRARWDNFFAELPDWVPGASMPKPVEYILKNALAVWPELCRGSAEMVIDRRKVRLTDTACRALACFVTHIVGAELKRRIEMTRGIHAVLRGYETTYHDAVRRAGRLTFADVQRLLSPDAGAPLLANGGSAAPDAAGPEAAGRRLLLDYRLDAQIDHWLLDEFQDTSFGQWSVLRNLIDEVVQDPEGRRSFFCVGDVKQAIYTWREGDPQLFREIFDHYNAARPGAIEEQHLTSSYRSGPALIEMVNAVFGNSVTIAGLFPGSASLLWNREWRRHESAVPDRAGQAALLLAQDEESRWQTVRTLLGQIRSWERGLTCAVLVKKNDTAAALADYLRQGGIEALAESDLHIATDNPLGAALLSLIKAAAHPGDTVAMEHVGMTPLGAALRNEGIATADALSARVLEQVHAVGFQQTFESWLARIEPALPPDDAFSRQRGREFARAAGVFDATGSRDCDEFIAFMERHTVRGAETTSVVRVMTIHKSKGLGFDVVVLPDLQGNRIDEPREGLAVAKTAERAVQWVLDLPPRLFCEQDEVLSAFLRSAEADACYENLSLLYVAMTRAKRAMYVVTEPVGKSTSRNFPRLLADTLGSQPIDVRVGDAVFPGTWVAGDGRWHESVVPPAESSHVTEPALVPIEQVAGARRRLVARRASDAAAASLPAAALFSLEAGAGAEFGSAVHALLAQVEWSGPADVAHWRSVWRDAGCGPAAIEEAIACLAAPALSAIWTEPVSGRGVLWRERSFECVLGDQWLTGVLDRVVVENSRDGTPVAATVFDFKTDAAGTGEDLAKAAERHRPQLSAYRQAVAMLTGLPPDRVTAELVFTRARRRIPVS